MRTQNNCQKHQQFDNRTTHTTHTMSDESMTHDSHETQMLWLVACGEITAMLSFRFFLSVRHEHVQFFSWNTHTHTWNIWYLDECEVLFSLWTVCLVHIIMTMIVSRMKIPSPIQNEEEMCIWVVYTYMIVYIFLIVEMGMGMEMGVVAALESPMRGWGNLSMSCRRGYLNWVENTSLWDGNKRYARVCHHHTIPVISPSPSPSPSLQVISGILNLQHFREVLENPAASLVDVNNVISTSLKLWKCILGNQDQRHQPPPSPSHSPSPCCAQRLHKPGSETY